MAHQQYASASLTPSRAAPLPPGARREQSFGQPSYGAPSPGYNSSFGMASPPASSATSYSSGYSGIGASPIRASPTPSGSEIIRRGWASVKEDTFASFLWAKKYLQLREQTLSFHKNEVSVLRHVRWL